MYFFRQQQGLSLVELMVAMTVSLFMLIVLGYVLQGAKQSFNSVNALSRIQENARFAFEAMGVDIRMAGYSGGPRDDSSPSTVVNTPSWDVNLIDLYGPPNSPRATQPGPTGSQGPLFGYNEGASTFPSFPISTPWLRGDALTIVHADNDTEYSITDHTGPTFTISCSPSDANLPQLGEIVVAADYTHSAVFQISAVTSCSSNSMTVRHNMSGVTPGNSGTDLGTFGGSIGARKLFRLKGATYYVANNPGGEPALFRLELDHSGTSATTTATELVAGVEDMQIQYGEDTVVESPTDLKIINVYRVANTVSDWSRVYTIRITLTMVSQQAVAQSGDRLLRKTFVNTIAVRNRLL